MPGYLTVIGGGLAGIEAAFQAVRLGVPVRLYEMRPDISTSLHKSDLLGELVGSNSFGVERPDRVSGLLIAELRQLGSVVLQAADATRLKVGGVLCVDRRAFAEYLTARVEQTSGIELCRKPAEAIQPADTTVVATGPLTSSPLARSLFSLTEHEYRFFYAATEPLFEHDSVELSATWTQKRFGDDQPEYRNCWLDASDFERFGGLLTEIGNAMPEGIDSDQIAREYTPIETIALRDGVDSLIRGTMNPAGLNRPGMDELPFAVCQLCPDDATGTLFRPVNMRTGLIPERQQKLFREISALRRVEFARFGQLHRAVFVDAPSLLLPTLQLRSRPEVFLAGSIAGLTGYAAAAASGCFAGIGAALRATGQQPLSPPPDTLSGAMCHALVQPSERASMPVQVTFGMLAPTGGDQSVSKEARRARQLQQSMSAIEDYMDSAKSHLPEL
ncbi:MAG: methylenetetrahydrofolate--tRNA-(uracil(54)-C(5))-methyltransferase (FADH(2)-oxidizing) TrmFO [candidate division WS1 bacterium]|jgi:methylenetetrahydrofolate--tRNA-(uracil-5-)-methyltransferase|nr:methylenetetrahydrofolate--tRNA-(uracil(54)-C(5))-methyltransferase (FADH(2)-oxidizing) TrmFO [candidate division WS1 bacterium]